MSAPEKLLDLVARLDELFFQYSKGHHWISSSTEGGLGHLTEWPRLSRAIREMHARLEDHNCFEHGLEGPGRGSTCGRCDFLVRLDKEPE